MEWPVLLEKICSDEVQRFLRENEHTDPHQILLKGVLINGVSAAVLANQLAGRRKARHKLPTWYRTNGVVYPPSINWEQCSSEATARYKSSLLKTWGVRSLVDLTGGYGVDSFFAAQQSSVTIVEPDSELMAIAQHNHHMLGANATCHTDTAEGYLQQTNSSFDCIYIDPARRDDKKNKVVLLQDCVPSVVALLPTLLERSQRVLIKASPMLDIRQGISELRSVHEVHVVSVDNECKELLFVVKPTFHPDPDIQVVLIRSQQPENFQRISFRLSDEVGAQPVYSELQAFLYEPDVSVLKAGAFKWIASHYQVAKLHPHTHLYTSPERIPEFPGRCFRVLKEVRLDKNLAQAFPEHRANILVRNHPLTVDAIQKKTRLEEGGELFLVCGRTRSRMMAVMAERVQ